MIHPMEPPMVALGIESPQRRLRVTPVPCQHVDASGQLILHAAGLVQPGTAIVLGAGQCQEIPLGALADRFARVTLTDHNLASLEEGLANGALRDDQRDKFEVLVADLTGVTTRFLERVVDCLDGLRDPAPVTAAEQLALLAEITRPERFRTGQRYDLVVASCVLCQLHLEVCNRTIALYAGKFPGRDATLRQSPAWIHAMYGLARRMEQTFVDALHELVAPGGRIYLSDTVQAAFLRLTREGDWWTDGTYRMTRTTELSDYLDHRFRIERRAGWHWVIAPTLEGTVGRIYNTQGLVLSTRGGTPGCRRGNLAADDDVG